MKHCINCDKTFKPKLSTRGKFCCYECYWKHLEGKKHKHMKGLELGRGWNKGIVRPVKYNSLHKWIQRNWGKIGICELCGEKRYTEFANKNGDYTRERKNYHELCRPCHSKIDWASPKKPDWQKGIILYG